MGAETTEGIRIEVETNYLSDQSWPEYGRYAFAYHIRIINTSDVTVQLVSRHWVITNALGAVEEVRGPGVVGQQPILDPGESHEYSSGAILQTPWGTMHGEYQMVRMDASTFDANIPCFMLAAPEHISMDRN